MENIVIIGSSGHSKVIIDIIESANELKIIGLCDQSRTGEDTQGYKVLGKQEDLPELIRKHTIHGVIVAIGDNFIRSKVSAFIKKICPNLRFVSAIHPNASIGRDVKIGKGSVVMSGVIINSNSVVGESCILNTASSLDHDSNLEDFASLSPGVRTGGNCRIGKLSAIGIGATLIHNINIGEETIIGAGSTVLTNIESLVIAYGSPAKVIRARKSGEKYL